MHALDCFLSMAPSQEGRNRCPGKTREYCGHSVRRVAWGRHPEMDSSGRSRLPGLQLPLGTGPRLWPQGGRLCGGHSSQLFFPWGVAWRSHEGFGSSAALRLFGFFFFFFSVFTSGQFVSSWLKQEAQEKTTATEQSGPGRLVWSRQASGQTLFLRSLPGLSLFPPVRI